MPAHVVIDASVWVSYFRVPDVNHGLSVGWLNRYLVSGGAVSVPTLVLSEVAGALVRQTGAAFAAQRALTDMLALPTMYFAPVDDALAQAAAQAAILMRLRGADAVYVALAQQLGIPLVTWDGEQLTRAASHLPTYSPATHPV